MRDKSTVASRQELIQEAQPLVFSLATRISRNIPVRVELDDLIAYGEVGLAEAARDFDPDRGVQFTTFAYYRVQGAIYDGLSEMSWISRARYKRLCYERMANRALQDASTQTGDHESSLEQDAKWFGNVTEKLAVVYLMTHDIAAEGIDDSEIEVSRAEAPSIVARE
jgi:RNA polymerase sigma factor for flagellar operon FliA